MFRGGREKVGPCRCHVAYLCSPLCTCVSSHHTPHIDSARTNKEAAVPQASFSYFQSSTIKFHTTAATTTKSPRIDLSLYPLPPTLVTRVDTFDASSSASEICDYELTILFTSLTFTTTTALQHVVSFCMMPDITMHRERRQADDGIPSQRHLWIRQLFG